MFESYLAIVNTLNRYAELMDAGDFKVVSELFEHDTLVTDGSASLSGSDAILQDYLSTVRVDADGTLKTQHFMLNPIVEIDEEAGTATTRSKIVVLQAVDGVLPLQVIITGRYIHQFRRIDGEWRVVERIGFPDQIGDLSAHLTDTHSLMTSD